MRPRPGSFSVVIPGSWNPAILSSPEWISREFFDGNEVTVGINFPVNDPSLPIRVSVDELEIRVQDNRLAIHATRPTEKDLGNAIELTKRSLERLRHTPIKGLGINMAFECQNDTKIRSMYSFDDAANISSDEYQLSTSKISRTFKVEEQHSLNLHVEWDNQITLVGFNFHYDSSSADHALSVLNSHQVSHWYKKSEEFLEQVFQEEIEELEEGNDGD